MFLEKLLSAIEPTSNKILKSIKANAKSNDITLSKYEIELCKIDIKRDLIKCVHNYVKPTDILTKVESFSRQGKIVAIIYGKRGDESFILTTDIILCGGHNIQRLHTRYIAQTNLPRLDADKTVYNELLKQRKQAKKRHDDATLLQSYKERLKKHREKLRELKSMSFDDVVENSGLKNIYRRPFKDLSKEDLETISKNNGKCLRTKEKYDNHVETKIGGHIKESHKKNIEIVKRDIDRFKQLINKIKI